MSNPNFKVEVCIFCPFGHEDDDELFCIAEAKALGRWGKNAKKIIDGEDANPPPEWCPLKNGPITVELEIEK